LGSQSLGDFNHAPAIPNGLVREHAFEIRPTSVENALCHLGLCEFARTNVADDDETEFFGYFGRGLMEMIFATIRNLRMDIIYASRYFASALGSGKFRLRVTVETWRFNFMAAA
jgi:hypothetical protein